MPFAALLALAAAVSAVEFKCPNYYPNGPDAVFLRDNRMKIDSLCGSMKAAIEALDEKKFKEAREGLRHEAYVLYQIEKTLGPKTEERPGLGTSVSGSTHQGEAASLATFATVLDKNAGDAWILTWAEKVQNSASALPGAPDKADAHPYRDEAGALPDPRAKREDARVDGRAGSAGGASTTTSHLDLDKAEEVLEPQASKDPGLRADLAKANLNQSRPEAAERNASKLIAEAPMDPNGWMLRSASRMESGDTRGAYADAMKTLSLDPSNKAARSVESYVKASQGSGRLPKPPDLRPLLTAGPGSLRGGLVRGAEGGRPAGAGTSLGDGLGAAALLRGAAPAAAPNTPSAKLVASAETKLKLKDRPGALLDATRAIELDAKNPAAWAERAEVSNRLGNPQAAVKDATEALRLDPGDAKAYRERSYAHYELGEYQEAFDDADKAVKLEPTNALGYLYRARAREKLGDLPGALKDYATAARLDPSLKPFYDDALARQGGGPTLAAAAARSKPALWLLLSALGAAVLLWGLRVRPGTQGATTVPPKAAAASAGPRSGTLPPGSVLGGSFRVTGELGRGGMGIVYDAMDIKLDRRVAVKQLRRELAGEDDLDRFLREARLAAKLSHPNIVSVLTVVEHDGEAFLVFEYVAGEPLDKKLERAGRLGIQDLSALLNDVCGALGYAHGRRIIHRDLKPSNILVEPSGRARIMDFGIAHQARTVSKDTSTAPWGTPAYMAPEQAMGRVSPASDLYALGVTAYELATGRLPFGGTVEDKLNKIYTPASRFGLSPAADDFFDRALEPDPAKRFASAAEFLEAFKA